MAHEVESMMYTGNTPWHGLGTRIIHAPTLAEGIVAAGLDWNVGLKPLYLADGRTVEEARATIRESDNSILGVVGTQYKPLQNAEAFNWFQPFLDAKEATLETAGSLRDGKRVFVLAKLNRAPLEIAKGDAVEKYILLSNSHDGTLAVRVGFTPIRVVCANTLAMALNGNASQLIRVRHSQSVVGNLNLIRDIMNAANSQFEATADQYRALAQKQISVKDLETYVKRVFDIPMEREEGSRVGNKVMAAVIPLFLKGRGNDLASIRGTYWAAYNAVTEYVAHERGKDAGNRLDSTWFGTGAVINTKALAIAAEMSVAA